MKLKHLFLTTLVVGLLASCSKDDDGPKEPVYQQIETYLSITATPDNKTITKSETAESEDQKESGAANEQAIKSIRAVVFYCDAQGNPSDLATIKEIDNPETRLDGSIEIRDIKIKVAAQEAGDISSTVLKLFLLANIEVANGVTDYKTFSTSYFKGIDQYDFNKVMANSGQGQKAYLPMSSEGLAVTGLVAGTDYNNWVEANNKVVNTEKKEGGIEHIRGESTVYTNNVRIPLTRYVARVQLESLTTDFGNNYENASFTLTQVSLANVSNASKYIATDENKSLQHVEMNGDNYNRDAFYRGFPEKIDRADYYLARGKYDESIFSKRYGTINEDRVENGISFSGNKKVTFKDATDSKKSNDYEMAQFYVFEFQNIPMTQDLDSESKVSLTTNTIYTMLIVTGFWDNGYVKEERSFRIPIRHSNAENDYQVKRNYIYKVNATLTGEGTPNPDKNMLNAFVSFSIDVDKWGVIKQNENDVN